jgi:hypothetical protein
LPIWHSLFSDAEAQAFRFLQLDERKPCMHPLCYHGLITLFNSRVFLSFFSPCKADH